MLRMETIIEMVGLATKVDTILIVEILVVEIPSVDKTNEEGSVFYLVDEVLDTLVNVVLNWIGEKIV